MWRKKHNICSALWIISAYVVGAIIPEEHMVCPIRDMTADEIAVTDWPEGKEYGRQSALTNR